MNTFSLLCSCALLPLAAFPQTFTFGVQGGVPAQPPLGENTSKIPFVLGPTLEIHLLSGLSLSTGVLFNRAGKASDNYLLLYPENSVTAGYRSSRSHAVELPLLAKYRFLGESRGWRPFLSLGATVRRTSIHTTTVTSIFSGATAILPSQPAVENESTRWNADPTAAIGVDFRSGRFHLEPEVRYSYWGGGRHTLLRQNQVQFLLGFRF